MTHQTSNPPLHILLVEDSDADAELVQIHLENQIGQTFNLQRFEDIPTEAQLKGVPDIALLDLNLPSCRGLETVRRFRQVAPSVPLIVLTGMEDTGLVRKALQSGAQDYFAKDDLDSLPLLRLLNFSIERFNFQLQQERLHAELEAQREQFRSIISNTSDGLLAIDAEDIVRFANPAAIELLGHAQGGLLNQPVFLPGIRECERQEVVLEIAGHERRELELNPSKAHWDGQEYIVVAVRDVTERKAMQQQMIQNERQNVVDQLASAIAHEFNNALAIIRMTVELLALREFPRQEQMQHLEAVLAEVERSIDLVNKLTGLSRDNEIEMTSLDISQLLLGHCVIYDKTLGPEVHLVTDFPEEPCFVQADANLVQQVVVNLIVNAGHACEKGGTVTLRLCDGKDAAGGPEVPPDACVLEVIDTGHGMSPEVAARIFEPFYTTKSKGRGTGLGLAVCRNIMDRLGGSISCESVQGQGTTFRLVFPKSSVPSENAQVGEEETASEHFCLSIALVDDNELLLALLGDALKSWGHEVQAFDAPGLLLEAMTEGYRPQVLLSDVVMPGMNGIQLLEAVRERHPACQCILMSGYNLNNLRGQIDVPESQPVLHKPFTNLKLRKTLREAAMRLSAHFEGY